MNKDDFRRIVKARRNSSDTVNLEKDLKNAEIITDRYLESDFYKGADMIFAYSSMETEISLQRIVDSSLKAGKCVAFPKIKTSVKAGADMDFVLITGDTEYNIGAYSILEPVSCNFINVNYVFGRIEMLIPGLCFDCNGRRIGYGGGYYDRYLTKYPKDKFHITALAYEYQIFDNLPFTERDIAVDFIVTENRCIEIDKRQI